MFDSTDYNTAEALWCLALYHFAKVRYYTMYCSCVSPLGKQQGTHPFLSAQSHRAKRIRAHTTLRWHCKWASGYKPTTRITTASVCCQQRSTPTSLSVSRLSPAFYFYPNSR
jgi:hypothetical protein